MSGDLDLLHLELGDAVAQQSAGLVVTFVDRDGVAGPGQLLGGGEAGGAGADDGNGLAGEPLGRFGAYLPVVPGLVDDRDLDVLDRHGLAVDRDDAGRLARSGTQSPGELGEVVGRMQTVERLVPVLAPHQVVPLGDQVAERAPLVAERDAAVHAATGLLGDDRQQRLARTSRVDLLPVVDALLDRSARRELARRRDESAWVSHVRPPPSCVWSCLLRTGLRTRPRRALRAPAGS